MDEINRPSSEIERAVFTSKSSKRQFRVNRIFNEGKDSLQRANTSRTELLFFDRNKYIYKSRRWEGKFRKIQSLRNRQKSRYLEFPWLTRQPGRRFSMYNNYRSLNEGARRRCLCCLQWIAPVPLGGVGSTPLSSEYLFIRRTEEGEESGRIDSIERYRARSISVGGGTVNLQSTEFIFLSPIPHAFPSFSICGTGLGSVSFFFFLTLRWVYTILVQRWKFEEYILFLKEQCNEINNVM